MKTIITNDFTYNITKSMQEINCTHPLLHDFLHDLAKNLITVTLSKVDFKHPSVLMPGSRIQRVANISQLLPIGIS